MCSYKQPVDEPAKSVHHYHFSMRKVKEMTKNPQGKFYCPSCMSIHADYTTDARIKVLLTSSILHEYWAPPHSQQLSCQYPGDAIHIDHVGIPGATIKTLTQAFRIDYEEEKRGIDVCLVAYYNDYLQGRSAYDIMRSLDLLYNVVSSQARHHHPDVPNSLAIATLPYPPQLCWFADDGLYPTYNYINNLEELTWLNNQIIRFNVENGAKMAPKFHTFGERTDNKKSVDRYGQVLVRHTRTHRWEHWREPQPENMLHLTNDRRMAMGKSVGNYFLHNTWD